MVTIIRQIDKVRGLHHAGTPATDQPNAIIVFAMPILLFMWLTSVNPTYLRPLLTDDFGRLMLLLAVAGELIGMAILWKMVSMEV